MVAASRRIVHVVTSTQRRGAESSAYWLAQLLRERGYSTETVALAAAPGRRVGPVRALGRRPLTLTTLLRLRAAVRSADVVIAHGSRTLPASALATWGLQRPVIYQNIGDPLFWAGSGHRRWRVRRLLGRMSAVAALTEQSARVLTDTFGVPADRVRLIRNMRDGQRFRPGTQRERERARASFGVPPETTVVASVGALSPEKRVDLAIAAVARTGGHLLVAGAGSQRAPLERRAEQLAPGRVRFVGGLGDVRPVLHASDVLLLTSDSEGVPGVLIEAGLCGRPAVSRRVGYVEDVLTDGVTGVLTDSADPAELARAVQHAAAHRDRLGAAARERCLARFDDRVVVDAWVALIDDVLQRRSAQSEERAATAR